MKSKIHLIVSLTLFLILSGAVGAFAQAPQKFNYQGIARDANGNPYGNLKMTLKLAILPASDATVAEYEEIQNVITNEFGLYTLQIGNGTVVSGDMQNVKWESGNKYIKVAVDLGGGGDFVEIGNSQLLSVPYAMYANKAGEVRGSGNDNPDTRNGTVTSDAAHANADIYSVPKFTAFNIIGKSQIYDNGTNIGIGTKAPAWALHIKKNTATYLTVQCDASNSTAAIRLQDTMGLGGELGISKFGSNSPGFFMGVSRKRMGVLNNLTGPFCVNAGGYMFFGQTVGGSQLIRLMIDSSTGYVGVGTTVGNPPTQKLDVIGQVRIRGGSPGAGKLLQSSANGTATWEDIVAFSAIGFTDSIVAGVNNAVRIYPTETFDHGGGYNTATGEFTAPVGGVYCFNYTSNQAPLLNYVSGHVNGRFAINNVTSPGPGFSNYIPSTTGYWSMSNTIMVKLNAGDVVKVIYWNATNANLPPNSNNGFSGFKVR